jgi:hypothetical protein
VGGIHTNRQYRIKVPSTRSAEILCDGEIVEARLHYPSGKGETLRPSGFDNAHINIERKTIEGLLGKKTGYVASMTLYVGSLGLKFSEATIDGLETYNVK